MLSSIAYLSSLAASTTSSVVVPIPPDSRFLEVRVASNWSNASASGLAVTFDKAPDGSTFSASNRKGSTISAQSAGQVSAVYGFSFADDPGMKFDASPVTAIRVNLSNADTVHAALVLVDIQNDRDLGR
jgi:hypothetical protein